MNLNNFFSSLSVMGYGMAGIFIVMIVLIISVVVLTKVFKD